MADFGRMVVIIGVVFVVIGVILIFSPKIPFLGKLPGDIFIKRGSFVFYSPITTSIIISIILTFIINFFLRK